MGFRFVRWLLMMFIFTFSSSHSHRGLIVIGLMILNEWNEWKLFVEGWKWTWQSFLSFLSFLQWWNQTRNEMKFQLHSFCFSFLQCLMLVSNSRKSKTIVILFGLWFEKAWFWSNWSKWSKSQPHLQSMFWICLVFFLLFWFEDCWKREMWKEVWNLLIGNNWWNSRKNEWKEKCDFSHLSNWMKLPRDWIGWMVEIGCNQTNNDFDNDRTRSSSSSFSEWEKCGFF